MLQQLSEAVHAPQARLRYALLDASTICEGAAHFPGHACLRRAPMIGGHNHEPILLCQARISHGSLPALDRRQQASDLAIDDRDCRAVFRHITSETQGMSSAIDQMQVERNCMRALVAVCSCQQVDNFINCRHRGLLLLGKLTRKVVQRQVATFQTFLARTCLCPADAPNTLPRANCEKSTLAASTCQTTKDCGWQGLGLTVSAAASIGAQPTAPTVHCTELASSEGANAIWHWCHCCVTALVKAEGIQVVGCHRMLLLWHTGEDGSPAGAREGQAATIYVEGEGPSLEGQALEAGCFCSKKGIWPATV
mmetsp:Transcript_49509/g.126146  ORF Transcript_49509/g.126146 Transcript_49509/m.126146 type:complete len:309 (-) Transcript_49509:118-1044(-)